jgi:methylenetetrahydrofolate dehydrogenase (NADP+)/methenyltetrahydrofolate cyclohydrolase
MAAELVKGAPLAARIREQVAQALAAHPGLRPCLANVAVGADGASLAYLDAIDRACAKAGLESRRVLLPAEAGEAQAAEALTALAADAQVHAILLQLPLPRHLEAARLAALVPPAKDVDGITRGSLGAVLAGERRHVAPCTAAAVAEILASDPRLSPAGRDVCIVGRSLVVGRPLAAMLAAPGPDGNATVTICHTRTRDLGAHTRRADIVVVAAGVRGLLEPGMLRPGAAVIDVGTHPVQGPQGPTLAGDADPAVAEVAGLLTPVPGGVGPVTNAILLRHVTAAALPGYLPPAW